MEALNYQHLYYFLWIMREGGVSPAARRLRLSHSTLSAQLRLLEGFLGGDLFERSGRRLVPTALGLQTAVYAGDIFRMGDELLEVARGRREGAHASLGVGVLGSLPKTLAYRLIEPALKLDPLLTTHVRQDSQARLLDELAGGKLHVVLTDSPPRASAYRLHTHVLGDAELLLYGSPALAKKFGKRFPHGLDGAPMLVPAMGSLRRGIERWLADRGIRVRVAGEIDDAGMVRVLGAHGVGLFAVRSGLRSEVEEAHGTVCLGALEGLRERYYAISVERKIRHRGVAAIVDTARSKLIASDGP